jgi:hypothetical protein
MYDILRLMASLGTFYMSGLSILLFIERKEPLGLGPVVKAAISFMIGMGVISLQMFVYSALSIPLGFFSVALPWGVLLPIALITSRDNPVKKAAKKGLFPDKFPAIDIILYSIIFFQITYVISYITMFPISGWDAWTIWFLKAEAFFIDGGVSVRFLLDGDYGHHPDYPLMIPLSVAWVYFTMGKVNEIAAKLIYPLQFLSLIFIFHYFVKKHSNQRMALLFTAMISLTPIILVHAAGFPVRIWTLYTGDYVGYSDLTLSIIFFMAGAFLYLFIKEEKIPWAILAALFLAMGAWTKNEGLPFALFGTLILTFHLARKKLWKHLTWVAVILFVFIGPWVLFKKYHHFPLDPFAPDITWTFVMDHFDRIKIILPRLWHYLIQPELFNFTWLVYLLGVVLNWRFSLQNPLASLNALLLFQFLMYIFAYLISPSDLYWQLATTLERVILQLVPLSMMISAINSRYFLKGEIPL